MPTVFGCLRLGVNNDCRAWCSNCSVKFRYSNPRRTRFRPFNVAAWNLF